MRTAGIIAEYNPFHTGHAYHIRKTRELSGADYVVVVMSPDFVQRGEPALFDKYTRARMALLNGADLVIELPVFHAAGSAEYFAEGSVVLLDRLGVVDTLCFGAETADPDFFSELARILTEEPPEYTEALRGLLRQGKTFPEARSEVLDRCLKARDLRWSASDFLASPNNILGTEYCKALRRIHSHMVPLPVQRRDSRYESLSLGGDYCSAAAIRSGLTGGTTTDTLLSYIPANCHELFHDMSRYTVTSEDLLPFLAQKLLACDSFASVFDISPDLSDRMRSLRFACIGKSFDETVSLLKTRQVTETHIRRALLHLILDIRPEDAESFRAGGTIFYAKVLGLRKDAAPLLHKIKEACAVPFLTKPAHASVLSDAPARRMWQLDLFASHLYRSILAGRTHTAFRCEYEISPIIL